MVRELGPAVIRRSQSTEDNANVGGEKAILVRARARAHRFDETTRARRSRCRTSHALIYICAAASELIVYWTTDQINWPKTSR